MLMLLSGISTACLAKSVRIVSPDKNLTVQITDQDGLRYSVTFNGVTVIRDARLGIVFRDRPAFGLQGERLNDITPKTFNDTWSQRWGERQHVINQFTEALTGFTLPDDSFAALQVRWRVYNDGIGFRYEMLGSGEQGIAITDELTESTLTQSEQAQAWWIPALGWNRYEFLYQQSGFADIDRVHTPFTVRRQDGIHISIHEAALVDFASMYLDQRRSGTLKAALVPRSDGLKVLTRDDFISPWRTIQVAPNAVGLINSDLIINLNDANMLGNVDWVEPGKYVGIWWGMHLGKFSWGNDGVHGATTERARQYIDFAAQHGFDGVLVEGWNHGWDGDWFKDGDLFNFTKAYTDFDLAAVSSYAREKGVRLVGHHETSGSVTHYEQQVERAYALYDSLDVRQVKTGYVADGGQMKRVDEQGITRYEWHDSQYGVNHYLRSVELAAKYKISINTHEPIKDTGLRRTYPNWISREGARGQEFNAWGSPPNPPEHEVNLAFTRMLSGPMDFTPGIFNLAANGLDAENRVQTTLMKQLALYVALYSPIQMVADLPEHYAQYQDAFQFIVDVPTDWSHSIALQGEVGDFVAIARKQRDGEDWYLGAITDENERVLTIPLSFLDANVRYQAQIYKDGEEATWQTNPYQYVIQSTAVDKEDVLTLRLAPSGGAAVRFALIKR
ncbi:glycoside hydrolase family 97 protein [Aestuariibacter salexigens]|uniref:glycoside hydrolase family 97 protein n=1 Tax=Aestuariibacter salexigens TaxID=226010 RepID=UPI0004098563|nr:glycoside hydrolase family 97 protein [Aestuariibacter salexigens]